MRTRICCLLHLLSAVGIAQLFLCSASGGSLYNASDARSAALGGEEVAREGSVLSAMDANPAALASLPRAEAAVTLTGALLRGDFQSQKQSSSLRNRSGFIGNGAVALPLPNEWPIRFGLAAIPDLTLESNWAARPPTASKRTMRASFRSAPRPRWRRVLLIGCR